MCVYMNDVVEDLPVYDSSRDSCDLHICGPWLPLHFKCTGIVNVTLKAFSIILFISTFNYFCECL